MGMSRKHYQALAEAIARPLELYNSVGTCSRLNLCIQVLKAVGSVCAEDNDRFDYDRFVRAFLDAVGEDRLSYYRAQEILRNSLPEYAE